MSFKKYEHFHKRMDGRMDRDNSADPRDNVKIISMQNCIQIYRVVQELWAFLLADNRPD